MTALERLIALYLQAEIRIVNEISRLQSLGLADYHVQASLKRVQAILKKLTDGVTEYTPLAVKREFYAANAAMRPHMTAAQHAAAYQKAAALTTEQTTVSELLVENMIADVTEASETLIGRLENDIYRAVGVKQQALRSATGGGVYGKNLNDFVAELKTQGVTCFVDKAGRKWSLHNYGAMVSRTTMKQANTLALLTRDPKQDLFQIMATGSPCPLCAPYEGRVYSKSGTSTFYPPLADAFGKIDKDGANTLENTYLNIHPNCRHTLMPFFEETKTAAELEKIRKFSNPMSNPYSVDPRTKKQIELYRRQQATRRRYLADLKQWERYRETLGDKVPKTPETFMRHKAAGDEKYLAWEKAYKEARQTLTGAGENAIIEREKFNIARGKINNFLLKPGTKHAKEFFDVGYTEKDFDRLLADIERGFDMAKAKGFRNKADGSVSFSVDMRLGVSRGKPFLTAWQIDAGEEKPRFISAHREDD